MKPGLGRVVEKVLSISDINQWTLSIRICDSHCRGSEIRRRRHHPHHHHQNLSPIIPQLLSESSHFTIE